MWADPQLAPSQAAAQVAERLLSRLQVDRSTVELLISTSVTRDYIEPAVAALVHGRLGLNETCLNFDLSNACLGTVNAIDMASQLIASGRVQNALIVCAENTHPGIDGSLRVLTSGTAQQRDFESLIPGLTLGCGAVAIWLTRSSEHPTALRVMGSASLAATSMGRSELCTAQRDLMSTQSQPLLRHGLSLAARTLSRLEARHHVRREQFQHFVCHQVSATHAQGVARVWRIPRERFHNIYATHGNMGPASVLYCLHDAVHSGRIQPGHHVLLGGMGSGINCTLMHLAA